MIRFLGTLLCMGGMAAAQNGDADARCQAAWDHLFQISPTSVLGSLTGQAQPTETSQFGTTSQTATDDGWCLLWSEQIFYTNETDQIKWRAFPAEFADDPDGLPQTFEMQINGTKQSDPVSLAFILSHEPTEGHLVVDPFTFSRDGEVVVAGAAELNGAFFTTPRAAQTGLPGLLLGGLTAEVMLDKNTRNEFLSELDRQEFDDFVAGLSFEQLDMSSRTALKNALWGVPLYDGTLEVTFQSERGLGLMQVGAAMSRESADRPRFFLDGANLSFEWDRN